MRRVLINDDQAIDRLSDNEIVVDLRPRGAEPGGEALLVRLEGVLVVRRRLGPGLGLHPEARPQQQRRESG